MHVPTIQYDLSLLSSSITAGDLKATFWTFGVINVLTSKTENVLGRAHIFGFAVNEVWKATTWIFFTFSPTSICLHCLRLLAGFLVTSCGEKKNKGQDFQTRSDFKYKFLFVVLSKQHFVNFNVLIHCVCLSLTYKPLPSCGRILKFLSLQYFFVSLAWSCPVIINSD